MVVHRKCRPRVQEHTLKASPSSQRVLLDVQACDSALARIQYRRTHLPELARINELENELKTRESRQVKARTSVSDLSEEQTQAEIEVEQVRARRERTNERLNAGSITNPKELASLQHELTALDRRIETLEDEELDVMTRLEDAEGELSAAEGDVASLTVELDEQRATRDSNYATLDEEAKAQADDRSSLIADVPEDLVALYEKLRNQYSGVGAAKIKAKQCQGCRLEINGADLRDIARTEPDVVTRCPECSRILVRTDDSGLPQVN